MSLHDGCYVEYVLSFSAFSLFTLSHLRRRAFLFLVSLLPLFLTHVLSSFDNGLIC